MLINCHTPACTPSLSQRVEVAVTQGAKYEHAWLREVEAREALARDVAVRATSYLLRRR